jgi:hypothetical protein
MAVAMFIETPLNLVSRGRMLFLIYYRAICAQG